MSLLYRRIIFSSFVLLFCIIVPVVLIYATGHTINWRRLSLEKTGSILIDSEPSEATVFLNGEITNETLLGILIKTTPIKTKAKINNLTPGEYTVRLEKEGYWSWEEKFNLAPDEVVNFGKIGLFSKSEPELIYELNQARAELSPDGKKIALFKNNILNITEIENNSNEILEIPLVKNETLLNWSNNNKKIILGNLLIDLDNKTNINLNETIGKQISLIRWSNNDDMVYFLNNKKLLRHTLSTKITTELAINSQIANQEIIDYLIQGDKIYLISQVKNNQHILIGSIEGKLTSLQLPIGNYKFGNQVSPQPVLINDKKIYLIDEPLAVFAQPRLLSISENFKIGHWQDNSLTYANGLELRRWDKEGQEYLLTRFGSTIQELWPINKKNSIIIGTPDDIRIYINGKQPFTINLADIKNSQLITASQDAKIIYVYGEYKNQTGLFRIKI